MVVINFLSHREQRVSRLLDFICSNVYYTLHKKQWKYQATKNNPCVIWVCTDRILDWKSDYRFFASTFVSPFSNGLITDSLIFVHCSTTSAAQRSAWASITKRAVWNKPISEQCEQTSERTSEWPSTDVPILVFFPNHCSILMGIPLPLPLLSTTLPAFWWEKRDRCSCTRHLSSCFPGIHLQT